MNEFDITIGIPTYNEEANILKFFEALKSQVLSQDRSVEVIFIDDSDDDTPQIIENLRIKNPEISIRLIHNMSRRGASYAWNTIFRVAKGKVLILFDADIALGDNCISTLTNNINGHVGLCASNTIPVRKDNNIYSSAATFIANWLRSMRMHGLSQYTTMGRALSIDTQLAKKISIPNETIAIDLYVQCMIIKQDKNILYDDNAKVYFVTPNNRKDFFSQIVRAMKGYGQIKEIMKSFNIEAPISLIIKEFLKNSIQYPRGAISLLLCYSLFPFFYARYSSKVTHIWDIAYSTKEYAR
ncbi:MAG TPA: glycosyltransferase family 2 protein [Candidatus Nitrosocosmicus sp.]|nr:glycosyltransferase family 2 protein [Candidatus Nitrosocosmicus sp.]